MTAALWSPPSAAQLQRAQEQVTARVMVDVLAYAEGLAVVATGLGMPVDAHPLVRRLAFEVIDGVQLWSEAEPSYPVVVQELTYAWIAGQFEERFAKHGNAAVPGWATLWRQATAYAVSVVVERRRDPELQQVAAALVVDVQYRLASARAARERSCPPTSSCPGPYASALGLGGGTKWRN